MEDKIKVFALGGLDEVGKNMYAICVNDEILVVDAGILFPDSQYGINYIINNVDFLKENEDKIVGIFITHGHEDHIGGLPYLYTEIKKPPVYASGITIGLINTKLQEYPLLNIEIKEYNENSVFKFKNFEVSFFRTTHSVPDSFGIAVKTSLGYILHTGDFKFDYTPIGKQTEFDKITNYSKEGVLLLMSDSTNALVEKTSPSEMTIGNNLKTLFARIKGRIIISTFSSNIYRVGQIVDAAIENDRRIIVFGRSMEKNIEVARNMKYICAPENTFIEADEYPHIPDNKIVVICTGSQGEPLAALARMADGTHRNVKVNEGDTIIFSSSVIPGNSEGINLIVNKLFKIGANVIVNSPLLDTHTSGHASQEELKLMLNLTKPKYFMPIHGEYAMLKNHTYLACDIGINKENCFALDNGDVLEITKDGAKVTDHIDQSSVFIDSNNQVVSGAIIKERRMLSTDGLVSIIFTLNENNELSGPIIDVIGFIIPGNSKKIINGLKVHAKEKLQNYINRTKKYNDGYARALINNDTQKYLEDFINRKPMVITSILKIK